MTTPEPASAEHRLGSLIDRLLSAGEASAAARDWEQARAMAEDVLTVDPGNQRAASLIEHVDRALAAPSGQRTLVTAMFSDIVESTLLAERTEPELMRDLYQAYREKAQEAIGRFGGHVVKYLGDGIVACFGYPDSHEDDARRAALAGLELQEGMQVVAAAAKRDHDIDLQVRVGLHTGVVVVDDLGFGATREREAMVGVALNLAARLQSEAEPGTVVASDVTSHIIETDFDLRSLGLRSLKGISRPVEVFAIERPRHADARLMSDRLQRGPLIGRDEIRTRLTAVWAETVAAVGTPGARPTSAILLTGEAGIGKSRMAAALQLAAAHGGAETLLMGCVPYYSNSAFWPLTPMLERFLDLHTGDDEATRLAALIGRLDAAGAELQRSVPVLAPLVGVAEPEGFTLPQLDPAALRQETLYALTAWLSTVEAGHPRLLVAEDIHWADPSTLELLGRMSTEISPGMLTLMTSRRSTDEAWMEGVVKISLDRLDDDSAAALVDSVAGSQQLTDSVRQSIVARSDGVPLFIEELTRSALGSPGSEAFPLRLQELLTARLNAPGIDMRLAQLAATLGTMFDAELLASLAGSPVDFDARLGALAAAGIVEQTGHPDGTRYRFTHALLRDAAYETQVLETRRGTHRDVASLLVEEDGDAALIARHFDLAGAAPEAVAQYLVASQEAQARGAHQEATQLTTRALQLVEAWPEDGQRHLTELTLRMLRTLSVSSVRGYAAPEVLDDYRRAEALSELLGSAPEIVPAMIAIWSYWLVHGEVATAGHIMERLSGMVEDEAMAWIRPEVNSCSGFQSVYEGRLTDARSEFEEAFTGYDVRPDHEMVSQFWPLPNDPMAVAAIGMAVVATLTGEAAAAEQWETRALNRARSVPFPQGPFTEAFVRTYMAWLRLIVGDRDAAQRLGDQVTGIGWQHGYAYWMALGSIYHRASQPDLAEYQQAMATLQAIGHEAFRASYMASLAALQADEGDLADAVATINEALLVVQKSGEMLHEPELLRLRATFSLAGGGDAGEAVADLERAVGLATEQGALLIALRAAVDLARLPEEVRPGSWRTTLEQRRSALPADAAYADAAAADVLLA